jgi:hypothetical protein
MYALNSLANYIQTELNDIAQTLYTNNDITHKIVFYVTDSEQSYDDAFTNMEYAINDEIKYTPVLLKRVFSTKQDDYTFGKIVETYRLEVMAFITEKTSVELIFDTFTQEQNQTDYDVVEGVQVKKNHSMLIFTSLVNAKSGTNKHFIAYNYEFTWDYAIGSVMKDSTEIFIDNVSMGFLSFTLQNDKIAIPNIAYGTNVLASTNGMTFGLTLPIVKGDTNEAVKNKELFDDITLNRYNKQHTLTWVLDDYKTVEIPVVIRSGSVTYNINELISFTVILEQALPRTTVQIDSVSVPVLSFALQREHNVESIVSTDQVQSVAVSSGYTAIIRFAHDHTNATSRTLLNEVINNVLGSEHTLSLSIGATNTITFSDTVIIKSSSYQFEQTGELIYEITFVKVV